MHDNKPGYYDCVLLSKSVRMSASACNALHASGPALRKMFCTSDHDSRGIQGGGREKRRAETA